MGRAARLFCWLSGIAIAALAFRYGLPLLAPFLLAWLLSFPIRRGAQFLERRLSLPRRVGACAVLLAVIVPLGGLIILLAEHLVLEAQQLLTVLGGGETIISALEKALDFFTRITAHLPSPSPLTQASDTLREQIDTAVAGVVQDTLNRVSAGISSALTGVARRFPSTLIFVTTFLIALFYCCTDDGCIASFLQDCIPRSFRPRLQQLGDRLREVGVRYVRAYFLLFVLTFVQLLAGFSLLGLSYVLVPALLISLLDILPVLGVGTILIPWGVISLLGGNGHLGTGLLILAAVMMVIRQWLEPKFLGSSLGLHPLATLIAIWVGLRLGGVGGMILAPAAAVVIKKMLPPASEGRKTIVS
jgi:sporulation integral membrane protein YtvI